MQLFWVIVTGSMAGFVLLGITEVLIGWFFILLTIMLTVPIEWFANSDAATGVAKRLVDRQFSWITTAASAFVTLWLCKMIFRWIGLSFTLVPILLVFIFGLLNDVSRALRAMRVWHARVQEAGLDRPDLHPDEQDLETKQLYEDVGREIRYALGHVIGCAGGAWKFLN